MIDVVAVAASCVLASISFPYWIARAKGIDLRAFGSRKLRGEALHAIEDASGHSTEWPEASSMA